MTSSGGIQLDPTTDQQTGIPSADIMVLAAGNTSVSPVPSVSVPGAMVTAGTIGGVDHIMFRFRMVDLNGNKTYLGSALTVGFNFSEVGTDPGKMTLYATVDSTQQGNKFFFQSPGTGLNESPSTTTLSDFAGNPVPRANALSLTSTTFDYRGVANMPTPELSYDRPSSGTDRNAFVTFAISFSNLQSAVQAITGNNAFQMSYDTEMKFIGFTASQYNAINQDIQGTSTQASNNLTTTWTAMGAFTDYVTATGYKKPIPEASTIFQVGAMLAAGLGGMYYQRRKAAARVV